MRPRAELLAEAVERANDLLAQWDCAACLCDAIVQKYQPLIDEFVATPRDNTKTYDIRMIRSVQDEKSNRDRWNKDAAALRTILSALSEAAQ